MTVDQLREFDRRFPAVTIDSERVRAEERQIRCNHCMSTFFEINVEHRKDEDGDIQEHCPVCHRDDALMDMP